MVYIDANHEAPFDDANGVDKAMLPQTCSDPYKLENSRNICIVGLYYQLSLALCITIWYAHPHSSMHIPFKLQLTLMIAERLFLERFPSAITTIFCTS